jgi:hypothetical protein
LPNAHHFFLVKSLAETTTTIFVEKSENRWNIRSDFGKPRKRAEPVWNRANFSKTGWKKTG